ncbi:MAG: sigma 54-interacting transcriptional regulator [Thermodesulfobacteriota bacterium]
MSDFSSKSLVELLTQVEVPQELCKTFIGTSVEAKLVRCLIMLAAGIDDHVLILGDTGTGKEVVARAIHDYKFSNNEFYPLNCAAISPYLLESELFGLRKGYPSLSSKVDKIGLWEAAKNGTLFLDEIGELRPDHQTKILRVLQEGYFRRVGGTEEIKAEARVIAATNRDIFQMAKNGQYREDLYYRLRGFIIRTPALRDHPEDIPLLAQSFWRNICGEKYNDLPPEIYSKLQEYGWPGNARELKMVLIGLHAFFGSANLTLKHLNAIFAYERQAVASRPEAVAKPETIWPRLDYLRHLRRIEEVIRVTKVTLQPVVQEHKTDLPTVTEVHNGLRFHLNELEVLCLHPSSFPSESTFSLVHDLKGKIAVFQGLLPKDLQHALRYWKKELAEGVEKVLSTIASELQKLLDNP